MSPPHLTKLCAAMILAAALSGCEAPAEARRDLPPPEPGSAPDLAPTASFDAPRAETAARQVELGEEASELAARADGLRAEAQALAAPVLTDAERDRLVAGP